MPGELPAVHAELGRRPGPRRTRARYRGGRAMATYPVVVGVDGSEESLLAAEWAALEARRHGLPLRIVSAPAMPPWMQAYQVSPAVAGTLRAAATRALGTAVARAEEMAPGLKITTGLLTGPPAVAVAGSGSSAA